MNTVVSTRAGERQRPQCAHDMHEYAIRYDGWSYEYNGYRYEWFDDALAYARLMRSRPQQPDPRGPFRVRGGLGAESETSQRRMASLGIELDQGRFRYGGFCYDRLVDAMDYALLLARRSATSTALGEA